MDCGGYLHSDVGISLGKLVRKPLLRAIERLERMGGEKSAAWAKATKLAGVMDLMAA